MGFKVNCHVSGFGELVFRIKRHNLEEILGSIQVGIEVCGHGYIDSSSKLNLKVNVNENG